MRRHRWPIAGVTAFTVLLLAAPASAQENIYSVGVGQPGTAGGAVDYVRRQDGVLEGDYAYHDTGLLKREDARPIARGAGLSGRYELSGSFGGKPYAGQLDIARLASDPDDPLSFYRLAWSGGESGFGVGAGPSMFATFGMHIAGFISEYPGGPIQMFLFTWAHDRVARFSYRLDGQSLVGIHKLEPIDGSSVPDTLTISRHGDSYRLAFGGGLVGVAKLMVDR